MHLARVVCEKLCNGDSIADGELEKAIEFFRKLESSLRVVGPVFQLAANEAGRGYQQLYGFSAARKRTSLTR